MNMIRKLSALMAGVMACSVLVPYWLPATLPLVPILIGSLTPSSPRVLR